MDSDPLEELMVDRRGPVNIPSPLFPASGLADAYVCVSDGRTEEIEAERRWLRLIEEELVSLGTSGRGRGRKD